MSLSLPQSLSSSALALRGLLLRSLRSAADAATATTARTTTTIAAAAAAAAAYLVLVRLLRYRRINAIRRRYAWVKDPAKDLTLSHARDIYLQTLRYEFPFMTSTSTQLALFRTYGLPKISILLAATQQLCNPVYYARRYADTEVAILDWTLEPPDSRRANAAIARVNWLHEHYKKHIDRDTMVYTLSVFVVEPAKFIADFEWRPRTDLENEAAALVWHTVGLKMGIADPPRTFADFVKANEDIESRLMRFHPDNRSVADASLDIFTARFPTAALRRAIRPFRALVVRHAMLPRLSPAPALEFRDGKLFRSDPTVAVYLRPTLWQRWGPPAWYARAVGTPVAGDDGAFGEGCDIQDLGPVKFVGVGREDVKRRADALLNGELPQPVWVE
ncbi:hypothetical protein DFJ73DRAFT_660317 [Zopfochytrium polystomum]|nr:hypothetical protein DFJ73DRAFT_660317 [Zopfochytrium polystomum]